MKKLFVSLSLIASVWSSFSYSENTIYIYKDLKFGATSFKNSYTVSPTTVVAPPDGGTLYISEVMTVTRKSDGSEMCISGGATVIAVRAPDCSGSPLTLSFSIGPTTAEPTQSCKSLEGSFIDGYHSSLADFCANIGSTGGENPEPLLCTATNLSEVPSGSGNFQHTVTSQTCDAETGPDSGDGEPSDPDPTDPTDPFDPTPDTGGNPTSGNANTTGTMTDSQGNVTDVNTTTEVDFSPVTDRQNETNSLLAQMRDGINGLQVDIDTSGIEQRLGEVKGELSGLRDDLGGNGTFQDGVDLANSIELPDESDVSSFFQQIESELNSEENIAQFEALGNAADGLSSFDSIPQFFQISADACTPIPFWERQLDICQYTPTIRNVLTFIATILLVLFLVRSITEDMKKIRLIS